MDFNSLSYFQPHEIYGIDLVKFVFLELSSNYFLIFFFTLLYSARLSHGPVDVTSKIICTVQKSILKLHYTSELPGEFADSQLCSHPFLYPHILI